MPLLLADPTSSEFSGFNGFLGTRGSMMMDIVVLAMMAVVPLMAASIYLVKFRQKYELHKRIQVTLGLVLLIAVLAFEVDIQFISKWEQRAEPSPHFNIEDEWTCTAGVSLIIHLLFAVPTLLLWVYVIVQALRKFPKPAAPNAYSVQHIRWAKPAAVGMMLTAVTGWTFYILAFVL